MADTAQPASQDDGPNPFADRLAADPSLGEVSLDERAGLNARSAYYRGTLMGAAALASAERNARRQQPDYVDEFGSTVAAPDQKKEQARVDAIRTDLARYEAMRSFEGPLEGLVSLIGQFGGPLASPETLITRVPGLTSLAERLAGSVAAPVVSRIAGAATTQAAVQGGVNPVVQGLEMGSGLRDRFDFSEVGKAVAGGALSGGVLHGAGEAIGALARRGKAPPAVDPIAAMAEQRAAEAQNMAALAREDPALRAGGDVSISAASQEAPKIDIAAERAPAAEGGADLGSALAPEAPAMDAPAVVADPDAAAARAAADVPLRSENAAASEEIGTNRSSDSGLTQDSTRQELGAPEPIIVPDRPRALASTTATGKPLSMSQFIARGGGIELDGDARAQDIHRFFVPGGGPVARAKGRSLDGFWRKSLVEHGYLPPDADGGMQRDVRREVYDRLERERRGDRTYSAHDAPPAEKVDSQAREIDAASRKITKAMKAAGLRAGDVDSRTLTDAAEMLWRGDADDPLVALEHAMMAADEAPRAQRAQSEGDPLDGLQFMKRPQPSMLARLSEALDKEAALRPERDRLGAMLYGARAERDPLGDLEAALGREMAASGARRDPDALLRDIEARIADAKAEAVTPTQGDAVDALERALAENLKPAAAADDPLAALERAMAAIEPERQAARVAPEPATSTPRPPAERPTALEARVLRAVSKAQGEKVVADMHDVRTLLPDVPRADLDRTMLALQQKRLAVLSQLSDPKGSRVRLDGGMNLGDRDMARHLIGVAPEGRALIERREDLQFRREPATAGGEPGRPAPPEGAAAADGTPDGPAAEPLRSLQQQAQDLADALDVPLRQGRVQGGRTALAQYDVGQDVIRIRNTADLESVGHEVAHAIENRVGEPLSGLIDRHAGELGRLDYDPAAARPEEGFAEWVRHLIGDPAEAQRLAPAFAAEFRGLMEREAPKALAALDRAIAAQRAWKAADPVAQLGAIVRKPDDEGFLRAVREGGLRGLPKTVGLYMHQAYTTLLDRQAPAARTVRQIAGLMREATGERLRLEGGANPENGLRAFRATQQAAISDLKYGVVPYGGTRPEGPSLADALAAATGRPSVLGRWDEAGVAQLNQYLVAKRADVLYRRMPTDPELRRPLAMTHEQVRGALAQMEAANPRLPQAADLAHQFTRQLLRKQYEGGLIDADLFGRLMDEEFYTPLYRHMDERPNAGSGAGGADGPGTVQTVKRLRGSDRDIIPPPDALMTQAILVNRTLQHNDIVKGFVGLARQAREAGATGVGRILEEIPATQLMGKRFDAAEMVQAAAKQSGMHADDIAVLNGALADVFGDDPIMATVFRAEQAAKRGEPIIFWKEGGQQRAVRLQSDAEGLALYESLAGLPTAQRDVALRALSAGTAVLRAGITKNPVFALTNFMRDQLAVAVLRPGYIPFVEGVHGAISALRNDEWAQMYAYAGGISPGLGATGLREMVDRDINALARQGWVVQKIAELAELRHGHVLAPLKAIGETVEIAEQGTRLSVFKAVYKQKKRQGLSDYDAMFEAAAQSRDLLDFDRKGSGIPYLRTLITFLNAHLQGLDKARRTLFDPLLRAAIGSDHLASDVEKLKNAGLSWGLLGASAGLGAAYGAMNADNPAYRNASEELRATHLIIPGAAFGRPGQVIVWPKPFELAMGFNLGEMAGLHSVTGDPRAADFALHGIKEVMQPPDPWTGIPLLKTGAELALNRSFFTRRDIVPEHLQNRENPRFEYNERTSSAARAIGDAINVSPIKVDYAVGSMFGSWGRDLMAASNTANPDAPAAAVDRTMILQRFVKDAYRNETDKTYWEQAAQRNGAFAQASARYGDLLKGFQDREAADYLAALPAAQRAYVMLAQGGDDDNGKAALNEDDRRLHPITRGAAAVQTVSGLIRELNNNSQKTFEDGTRIGMDPQKRRDVIDALRTMQAIEQHNAMVMTRQRGYENQPLISAEDQFAVLKAQSPVAADELATRYATNKILPTDTVAKLWPEAQRRLLADGTQAEIHDLALDAKGDGWAFGGDAVRKPQRRRVSIDPNAPPPARNPRIPAGLSVPHTTTRPNPFN